MKKRWISFLLVVALVCSLGITGALAADPEAANESTITNPDTAWTVRRDLNLSKVLTENADGTFNLQLETYATGEVTTRVVTTQVPTDFVLVVDQSGSMAWSDIPTSYQDGTTKTWELSDISDTQARHIKSLGIDVIIAFDAGLNIEEVKEQAQKVVIDGKFWRNKVGYIDMSGIHNKVSPTDMGYRIFKRLVKERTKWI